MTPNARGEPRPEAGAQRTLEGVGSTAWFGSVAAVRSHARYYSPPGNSYKVGHASTLLFSGGVARRHPAGKGLGTFPTASPREETFYANMLIESRPLDRIPVTE